jgi:hypothetical protein
VFPPTSGQGRSEGSCSRPSQRLCVKVVSIRSERGLIEYAPFLLSALVKRSQTTLHTASYNMCSEEATEGNTLVTEMCNMLSNLLALSSRGERGCCVFSARRTKRLTGSASYFLSVKLLTHIVLSKAQNRLLQDVGGVIFLAFCGQLVMRDVFCPLQWA